MLDFVLSVCVSDEAELWVSLFLRDCSRVWKIHMILIVQGKTTVTPWLVHSNKVVLHLTIHTVLIHLVLWYGCVTVEKVLNNMSLNACRCHLWSALWRVRVRLCRFNITLLAPQAHHSPEICSDGGWSPGGHHIWWLGDSPHKGPVMQKAFPCHDVLRPLMYVLTTGKSFYTTVQYRLRCHYNSLI